MTYWHSSDNEVLRAMLVPPQMLKIDGGEKIADASLNQLAIKALNRCVRLLMIGHYGYLECTSRTKGD